ncbi:MAG: TlpA disulfide reductase family protein [Geothermobacteraceae bacterium]
MRTLLSTVLVFFVILTLPVPAAFALEKGEAAPGFTLPALDGGKVSLASLRGRVVVLDLATTWCPSCRQQMEELEALRDFFRQNDVAVLQVFLQDTEEMVREHVDGRGHPDFFVHLLDDGSVRRAYNVYLIPRLLVLDRELNVVRDGSLMTADAMRRLIESLPRGGQ